MNPDRERLSPAWSTPAAALGRARLVERPRLLAVGGVMLASAAAWVALAAIHVTPAAGGIGGIDWIAALCRAAPPVTLAALPAATAIWLMMSVAMMLPTAAPAIDVHVRLTRRLEAGRPAQVSAFAAGYLAAWAGLALAAAAAQVALGREVAAAAGVLPPGTVPGGLLLLAGLYQLTPLKQACLALCRNPLAFFLSHWREGTGGALVMGLRHGAVCIGCCWALMGLMFLAGAANLAWMAALGLVMLLEKLTPGAAPVGRVAGLAMALAGAALIVDGLF